jgi:hypothetical protein
MHLALDPHSPEKQERVEGRAGRLLVVHRERRRPSAETPLQWKDGLLIALDRGAPVRGWLEASAGRRHRRGRVSGRA